MADPMNPELTDMTTKSTDEAPWPFLHSATLERLNRGSGLIVLHGMRGAGKSLLLRELQRKRSAELISGRHRADALNQLANFAKESDVRRSNGILIDDVDLLLRDPVNNQLDHAVIDHLWTLKESSFADNWLFVLAVSEHPGTMLDYDMKLSDVLTSGPRPFTLKPWVTDTEGILTNAILDKYGSFLDKRSVRFSGKVIGFSTIFVSSWCTAVQELTGGHPTLVGPAMDLFEERLKSGVSKDEMAVQVDSVEATPTILSPGIRADLARTGMTYVRRRIRALESCARHRERTAFAALLKMARGKVYTNETLQNRYGMVLERECLAFLDQELGTYRILGSMIQGALLARLEDEHFPSAEFGEQSEIIVRPGPEPDQKGVAYISDATGRRELTLSGSLWQVLRVLEANRGRYVSLTTIMDSTSLSETAVRSALYRLSSRLEKELGTSLENSYGQGYRLS